MWVLKLVNENDDIARTISNKSRKYMLNILLKWQQYEVWLLHDGIGKLKNEIK